MVRQVALTLAAMLAPVVMTGTAQAQAYRCVVPTRVGPVHADLPTPGQPRRVVPIGGYTLAISWAPQYCRTHRDDASARVQCRNGSGGGNRFGFTLHGLWPDGEGAQWPQYCRATALLPAAVIRRSLCATPSPQLLQHEWAKHGTCTGETPARYFGRATALYGRLRYPDLDALSRRPLTAGALAQAMADANPGLGPDMMRITADREGWLDEIWICLDRQHRYARCPAHQGGLAARERLQVWRGRR